MLDIALADSENKDHERGSEMYCTTTVTQDHVESRKEDAKIRKERTTKRMKGGLRYPEPHVSGALDVERKEEDAQIRNFFETNLGALTGQLGGGNKDQKEGSNKINLL